MSQSNKRSVPEKYLKPYDPKTTENGVYEMWQESGFFNPDNLPKRHKEPFTIIMPPPNANGRLHAGHGLAITLEDIIIRYKRMRGFKALWVPGADHAGFETQIVYEKQLEKEGRSRFKMDPQDLYKEILAFTLENKKYMEDDVRRLGASCDWSREKFTLDSDVIRETHKTFKKMFDDGLVYRGERIVNWCPKHQTSLSEVETEFIEKTEPFYFFQYGPFVISTSRPETKFGDKFVVVHPNDVRYKKYEHGQKIDLEWINGPITATVIKDEAIDMEFGTGAMTITPWHDVIDFDIALRHGLPKEQIIDWRGKLLPIAGEFEGMKINEARPKIIEKLKSKGLLVKTDDKYVHNIKVCYKCETLIEPQVKKQWFVKMKPLAKMALDAVKSGEIQFVPDNYEKIFTYWMENPIDWNISRQIVWGIPIPAKLCESCDFGTPDLHNTLSKCPKCNKSLQKDTDTFDTWFSSGQWPLLSLGYPDGKDFKNFYPTQIMETGSDLIFKWIPRMVIFGLYLAKKSPFNQVYLHGMVNDAKGKKMSKSKGNVISPIELMDKFGTDAFRIGMVIGNTPGTSLSLSESKIQGYKNFSNKLWNISRFVFENTNDEGFNPAFKSYSLKDTALLKDWQNLLKEITKEMDDCKFYLVGEKLYAYVWHSLADKILEDSKGVFASGTTEEQKSRKQFLLKVLSGVLKTLHPFMPFVTEEIWKDVQIKNKKLLLIEEWPE